MKNKSLRTNEYILIAISVFFALTYLYLNVFCFERYATSDVYADMLYAMEAWDAKSIFPDGWVFGNQFYTVATPVLCSLLYGIFGSAEAAMIGATLIMSALVITSFIWMLKPIFDRKSLLASIALLLSGITTYNVAEAPEGQLLFLLASYYSCYIIAVFIVLGDYIRSLVRQNKRFISPVSVFIAIYVFAIGMQSVRQTAILILPLLAFGMLRILIITSKRKPTADDFMPSIKIAVYTVANFAGLLFIKLLNAPNQSIYGDITVAPQFSEAHVVNMRILGKLTGFYYVANEKNTILFLIPSLILTAIVIYSIISSTVKAVRNKKFTPVFCVQAILLIGLIGLFTANLILEMSFRTTYMFLYYALVAVCAGDILAQSHKLTRTALILLLCVACIFNWMCGFLPAIQNRHITYEQTYYEPIAEDLDSRGFKYLYGDWYTVTMIAIQSETNIRAYGAFGGLFKILPYINPQNVYDEEHNASAAYVVKHSDYPAAVAYAESIGATLTHIQTYANGAYTLFTSDKPLMHRD